MGHIYSDIKLVGQTKKIKLKNVLIDTGATYTVVKPDIINSIDAFELKRKLNVELGNGKKVIARVYALEARIGKHFGPAWVISFTNAKNVIGVETLESLGLRFDLKKHKLEKTRPAGFAYFYKVRSFKEF